LWAEEAATAPIDANGNLLSDGTRTFTWDAENRLVSVTAGTHASEFSYDGLSRRVRILEKDNGSTTSDKRFLWCGRRICEERDSSGATVTKRFFSQGTHETAGGGTSFFYARDHLGSIREMTDSAGVLRARYDYSPWGQRQKLSGDKDADFGYTGHYEHAASGLTLTLYRAYDRERGRWLSEDPIGLEGGINLYDYTDGNPIGRVDPDGLSWWSNTWTNVQAWGTNGVTLAKWVTGFAPTTTTFGPGSPQVAQMQNAPGVNNARNLFIQKGRQPVTNFAASFGLFQGTPLKVCGVNVVAQASIFSAGLNATQQFVGSYAVSVSPAPGGKTMFVLTNTTSLQSLLYGVPIPGPSSGPFQNMNQNYVWIE
jgi:RHS repeat-associated protein